tara:strand:- start:1643 stop:2638 length:996 start_codon:yes stop_codon:yes gene_type:complete
MIIKNNELQKLKATKSNLYLLYGENRGFKNQFINNNLSPEFKENIFKYNENEIFNDYNNFITSILNKSFFEKKKLYIISNVSEKILKLVEDFTSSNIEDITIIILASILDKRSKLRSFFEKEKNTVCIPFYTDQNKTLSFLASNFFQEKKISISQEVINFLVERCRGDRSNLNNEMSKIYNYAYEKKNVTFEEVFKITNLAENYSINELIDNCLAKNKKRIGTILNQNNFSDEDCILILRTMLNKSKRILKIINDISDGNSIDSIISTFKPPIFWKDKEIVKTQIMNWDAIEIENLIYKINDIEFIVKKNATNTLNIVSDFILNTSNKSNN